MKGCITAQRMQVCNFQVEALISHIAILRYPWKSWNKYGKKEEEDERRAKLRCNKSEQMMHWGQNLLPWLIRVSSHRQDLKWLKTNILSTRRESKKNLHNIKTTGGFYSAFQSTEIRVTWSNWVFLPAVAVLLTSISHKMGKCYCRREESWKVVYFHFKIQVYWSALQNNTQNLFYSPEHKQ